MYDLTRDEGASAAHSFVDPNSGEQFSTMWLVPNSKEDLARRRAIHTFWAEPTFVLMGRTPDHVACFLVAFIGSLDVFGRSESGFPDNVSRFYRMARAEDLYVATRSSRPRSIARSRPINSLSPISTRVSSRSATTALSFAARR